ncbi:uncharacterized protein PHACADRAFT_185274 [Phanerochaete carnosa HHB-10118-sp]|uniref:Uncharacterized protein n=1 Tax=Phanerochaete carnosa (strain HHB-10118-sp) TaxID=650164 RepID=K5WV93_PHACS|nr:uncharacterized protein PHACADRAFT_185274 [Phanerochaete carnosa HHB-10118-sp]EKM54332.1 hypothetical protein PHACADRAFT_185274 [Phanerochaete carnosa HHB-10118-sp]
MAFSQARSQLASMVAEAIAYGEQRRINVVVFGAAMTLILTRRERNRVALTLGAMTVLMFVLATTHFAAVNEYTFRAFVDGWQPASRIGDPPQIQSIIAEIVNCSLGDSLVIWRAWGLWGRSYKMIVVPTSLWVVTLLAGAVTIWLTSSPLSPMASANKGTYLDWLVIWATLVLATNMWTVGMISWVYWRYHQDVIKVIGWRKAAYGTILIFLIESGALYCITWATLKIEGAHIIALLASEFTCLYPTLIIVVVCLGLTQQDRIDSDVTLPTDHQTVEFERPEDVRSLPGFQENAMHLLPITGSTGAGDLPLKDPGEFSSV